MSSARVLSLLLGSAVFVACAADGVDVPSRDEAAIHGSTQTTAGNGSAEESPEAAAIQALMRSVWLKDGPFDYLPWEYAPDGCFDRSYYMSMELAARGVPVRQEVINMRWIPRVEGRPQFEPVDPTSRSTTNGGLPVTWRGMRIKWDYHIAAVLLPGAKVKIAEPMILDRALEPGPVTVEQWVNDANSGHIPRAESGDTEGFNQFSTKGAPYVGVGPFLNGNWATDRSDPERMPTFKIESIKISCNHLHKIWSECIGGDGAEARAKKAEIRTNELLRDLDRDHLLEDWDGQPVTCSNDTAFRCTSISSE